MITQDKVRQLFAYHKSGTLIRNVTVAYNAQAGDRVGYSGALGYKQVTVEGVRYYIHQLIFLWHHGHLPTLTDHINRCRSDNRIENLRECTPSMNNMNQGLRSDNTSGHKGIDYINGKYRVRVKGVHIGMYTTYGRACKAYKDITAKGGPNA